MLIPKQFIYFDYSAGETLRIDDITGNYNAENTTGYGSPNPAIWQVNKVRFLFSSFLTERNANTNVKECLTNVEYRVVSSGIAAPSGPTPRVIVDTKRYFLNDTFILMSDQTPVISISLALEETGRYACVTPFLPVDFFTTFAPSAFGIDQLIFPDSAYTSTEEVYTTSFVAGNVFSAGTYIVKGDPLNRIKVAESGSSYYVGEVFTTTTDTSFSDDIGTNQICLFAASGTLTFPLTYYAQKVKDNIQTAFTTAGCPCKDQLEFPLFQVYSRLQAIQENYADELNNSDSYTQTLLDEIASIGARTQLC